MSGRCRGGPAYRRTPATVVIEESNLPHDPRDKAPPMESVPTAVTALAARHASRAHQRYESPGLRA